MTVTYIGLALLTLSVTYLLKAYLSLKIESDNLRKVVAVAESRIDSLNDINLSLQNDLKTLRNRLETTTELSVLNNQFIEQVKETAKENSKLSRIRAAAIQTREVR